MGCGGAAAYGEMRGMRFVFLCFFWLKLICGLKFNCFYVSCPSAEGLFFVAVVQQHTEQLLLLWHSNMRDWLVAVVLVNLFGGLVGMVWD